ncbi:hypothetical protein AB0442_06865 [Kitasatospora sp. NPDC085895]|uniref:hypothetical protein n=1 Tax=Kitasatospora sp. NPDC085895 TaxID=3155057 RepID=UPI00344E9B2B
MTHAPTDTGVLPQTALAKLTELRELAAGAVESWESGDLPAAHRAVTAAASVAAAVLDVLAEAEAEAHARAEADRRPADAGSPPAAGPVGHWWG